MPKVIGGSIERHRELVQAKIFDAFATLIHERGYDAVSLADVAAAAGLARTAMYNYVPDKETLLLEYTAHETNTYLERLGAALAEADGPIERLRAYIRTQLTYFATHHMPSGPGLHLLVSGDGYARMHEHVRSLEDVLREILADGQAAGALPATDVDAALPLVVACLSRSSLTQGTSTTELEDVITHTTSFVLRALGAPDP